MRKYIALFLALALMCAAGLTLAEADVTGLWYMDLAGAAAELTLNADGTYRLAVPLQEDKTGAWKLDDGFLYMDGAAEPDLATWGEGALMLGESEGFFTREKPWTYAPADPLPDIPADLYAGLWKAAYTLQDGAALPADRTGDNTIVYIEGAKAILKGGPFGYILVDLSFENGVFTCAADGLTVRMALQQDDFLRLTTEKNGQTETRFLLRSALEDSGETGKE